MLELAAVDVEGEAVGFGSESALSVVCVEVVVAVFDILPAVGLKQCAMSVGRDTPVRLYVIVGSILALC